MGQAPLDAGSNPATLTTNQLDNRYDYSLSRLPTPDKDGIYTLPALAEAQELIETLSNLQPHDASEYEQTE